MKLWILFEPSVSPGLLWYCSSKGRGGLTSLWPWRVEAQLPHLPPPLIPKEVRASFLLLGGISSSSLGLHWYYSGSGVRVPCYDSFGLQWHHEGDCGLITAGQEQKLQLCTRPPLTPLQKGGGGDVLLLLNGSGECPGSPHGLHYRAEKVGCFLPASMDACPSSWPFLTPPSRVLWPLFTASQGSGRSRLPT